MPYRNEDGPRCELCGKATVRLYRRYNRQLCDVCVQVARRQLLEPSKKDLEYRQALRAHMGLE